MLKYLFIIFYLIILCESRRVKLGQKCYTRNRKVGVCTLPSYCPTILDDIINEIYPQTCGWNKSLYCCVRTPIGQKSIEMCKKYEDLGFKLELVPTLTFSDEYIKTNICPYDDDGTPVIYGGEEAKLGEFPHMALIGFEFAEPKWKCSGSLLSSKFVVSAGHCLYHEQLGNPITVRLGDLNFTATNDDLYVQEIPIKKTHKHPHYRFPSTYHDIALFELEYPVKFSIYVKPICIYTKEKIPTRQVLAVGWGDTERVEKGKNDMLMKVALDVYDTKTCAKTYPRSRTLPGGLDRRTQVCAGSKDDSKDTCQGDSGGPIQIRNRDVACSYYLLGITSHGKECGIKLPAVYIRIYPYIKWIEDIIYRDEIK